MSKSKDTKANRLLRKLAEAFDIPKHKRKQFYRDVLKISEHEIKLIIFKDTVDTKPTSN